jgi:uridylate kinase
MFNGEGNSAINLEFVSKLAAELKEVTKTTKAEIVVVVGGGNIMRGASEGHAIERVTADYMGILGTVINGMALVDAIEKQGLPARLLSRINVSSVAEPYIRRRAIRHLEKGRLVIVAGGTGNPYVTTDTAAVITALEQKCEVVMKATKVDGVYDKDPAKNGDAKKLKKLGYNEVMTNQDIAVMDSAAISMAHENHLPIVVFDLSPGNIQKVIEGQSIGTVISD